MKDASYDYEQAQKLASFKTRLSVANALMAYTWALIAGMELYLHTFSNQGFVIYAVVLCAVVGNGLTIKAMRHYMDYQNLRTERLVATLTANQQEVPKKVEV